MAAGFLGRFYRLGRNLINYGLGGGSGAPPVVLVPVPGCAHLTFAPTALVSITSEPTATATLTFEPMALATLTVEVC